MEKVSSTQDRLREALAASGKKQAELCAETGLDKGAVSCYMSGKYEPKQKAIGLLARALDVSEMWLWGYDVPMERTAEQKKNDDIVRVVAMLRKDPEFFEIVSLLGELPSEQYASIKSLILALAHK